MNSVIRPLWGSLLLSLAFTGQAFAYIGPGLGVGSFAVLFGIVGSILLALFAIVWYPIKRLLRRGKNKSPTVVDVDQTK